MNKPGKNTACLTLAKYIYFTFIGAVALVSLVLSVDSFIKSGRQGPRGNQGYTGQKGQTGDIGPEGPPVASEVFLYYARLQPFPINEFYTVNYTIGGINNTNFDGVGYTAPSDGIYQFTTLNTLDIFVQSTSDSVVESSYLINGVQQFIILSTFFADSSEVFAPIYLIWTTQLNTGDRVTINLFAFGATGLHIQVDQTTSYFMGYKIADPIV